MGDKIGEGSRGVRVWLNLMQRLITNLNPREIMLQLRKLTCLQRRHVQTYLNLQQISNIHTNFYVRSAQ